MQNITNQFIYAVLSLAVFCTACGEGSFTKIVDIPLAESDTQLTVIANLDNSKEDQFILVSKTLSVLDNGNFESLNDAQVSLTTPDLGVKIIQFNDEKKLYSLSNYKFKSGESYTLDVDHPDFAPMTATITVPQSLKIIDSSIELNDVFDFENFEPDLLTIKFKDPGDEINNYKFVGRMYSLDTETQDTFENNYYFDLSNNILEYNDNVITDITFNGKEYEIVLLGQRSFYTDTPTYKLVRIEVDILSLTEDLYLYDNSISQAEDAVDNPFVEPSTIYTNFDNGFGIFTINNVETVVFDF